MKASQTSAKVTEPLEISLATLRSLPVRPSRRPEESSEGHWLRVAHANGLAEPAWLLDTTHRRALSIVRVCPQCLAGPGPQWSGDWKDRWKPFCSGHGLWLVDRCSQCERMLRWSSVSFLACRCGQDLRELHATALSVYMTHLLEDETVPFPVLLWLGSLALHGLTMKPLKKASRVVLSEVVKLAEAGADIVVGWPGAFHEVLDRCCRNADGPGDLRTMNQALPGFTRRMSKLRDQPWRERIAKELAVYVSASHRSDLPITGRNVPGPRHPTVAQIARELGMRSTSLIAALEQLPEARVAEHSTPGGRRRRLVSAEAVRHVQQQRLDKISIKAATRLTGLSAGRIRQLVDAGLLEQRKGRLSGNAVKGLSQSLLSSGRSFAPDDDAISLRHALRYCVPVSSTSQFILAIREGVLTVFVPDGAKLLSEAIVSEARCRKWAVPLKPTDSDQLTIPECAEILHMKQEVAYHLVRVGLLRVHTAKTGRRRSARMTTAGAVERFKRDYEPLVRLAASAGIDHRSALNWAKSQGIALVSGPSIDGGRQYIALRPRLNGSAS